MIVGLQKQEMLSYASILRHAQAKTTHLKTLAPIGSALAPYMSFSS